jgi:hypothetical protein
MSLEAHGVASEPYRSADLACERLEKRVRRYTRKVKKHSGAETVRRETPAVDYVLQVAVEGQEESDEDNPIVIADTATVVHEMAVSDAVMQMDLSDRPFLLFRNATHGEVNVVYRREDGNIGWIDPAGKKARKRR